MFRASSLSPHDTGLRGGDRDVVSLVHGRVCAVGRPLHTGRRTIVVRTEMFDTADRMVGHVVQSQAVLPPAHDKEAT